MTSATNFAAQLQHAWHTNHSLLCVGLDPDPKRLPTHLQDRADGTLQFCCDIVDATADLVCAFKPQIAYFASQKGEGQLAELIQHIHTKHPGIPVILDAKRGDIGATAQHYAKEAFVRYQADALTVNPYMGFDSLEPYWDYPERGLIILCRTSNPGGSDLQNLALADGRLLYQHVAQLAAEKWNPHGQTSLVVGATFPQELAQVRALIGDMPLLVPGIGAQGGDVAATLAAGQTADSTGLMINSSRAILYASSGEDFAHTARQAALNTRTDINTYRHAR